jgi:hypothetical protein
MTDPREARHRSDARHELRERALELRRDGWSVNELAIELRVAKSTAYEWTKHLPLDDDNLRTRRRERCRRAAEARWGEYRRERDQRQRELHDSAMAALGRLDERDLLLLGAAIYWSEGSKSKPWRRDYKVVLVNSDPLLLAIFLSFLASVGKDRSALRYRVSIHESADPAAAVRWWTETLRLPVDRFQPTSLKRHRPRTTRHNTGEDYHGCLTIFVPGGREIYWLLEGVVKAAGHATMAPSGIRPGVASGIG